MRAIFQRDPVVHGPTSSRRPHALHEAQMAMIANPATQNPYYWAAFVSIRNWMPLARSIQ
jgi:hypothetical protein